MDCEIANEDKSSSYEDYIDHSINEDENTDTIDTNEFHSILHQPSPHNVPNINNQNDVSNENHQNQVEEAESFTLDNDNLSNIFQNTEEEIIFEPEVNQNNITNEMYQEYFKENTQSLEDEIDEGKIQSLVDKEKHQHETNINNEIDEDVEESNLEEEQNATTYVENTNPRRTVRTR